MKTVVTVMTLGLLVIGLAPAYAQDHYIADVEFAPNSPADLVFGEQVTVTYYYETTWPEGVRIYVRPFTNGALTPHYGAQGSPLWPVGSGAGNSYFTINSGEVVVDHVRFQMYTHDQSQLLLEEFVECHFHYSDSVANEETTWSGVKALFE